MNVVMNRYIGLVACGLLVALTGCEPGSSDVKVTGNISVAGAPIEQGSITFLAEDGAGPTGGGVIKDGKFEALVPPGKKIVLVNGSKVVGTQLRLAGVKDSGTIDKLEAVTHLDYNSREKSPLRADITGPTEGLEFKLTADGKGK